MGVSFCRASMMHAELTRERPRTSKSMVLMEQTSAANSVLCTILQLTQGQRAERTHDFETILNVRPSEDSDQPSHVLLSGCLKLARCRMRNAGFAEWAYMLYRVTYTPTSFFVSTLHMAKHAHNPRTAFSCARLFRSLLPLRPVIASNF